jgi:hypothetical protein
MSTATSTDSADFYALESLLGDESRTFCTVYGSS